jgi:hypothetical protein
MFRSSEAAIIRYSKEPNQEDTQLKYILHIYVLIQVQTFIIHTLTNKFPLINLFRYTHFVFFLYTYTFRSLL